MNNELISKKELLDLTGISYGQLYRWKRKSLIPEDWFIRKSSFTGQETFFPKEKILSRIDKILNMKDGLSLDELADVFSPSLKEISLTADQLLERNIVTNIALDVYLNTLGHDGPFRFEKILSVFVLEQLLRSGEISLDEGKLLIQTLSVHYPAFAGKDCQLVLIRKMGVAAFILMSRDSEVYFDSGVKEVVRLSLAQATEELKLRIGEGGE
ncbi:YhbD family protein [Paenibacillus sp. YPG26]|uniref:YhbD family protein n=1 Tax=Paenibacillus sp. YPG26 TaxID=2878915 RepID=UPI00203F8E35|nr:YhbD family protein [Paenibacillus sp. YPG26]USB32813.1 YhbD family protein [Paenibacillus sp. YPG26]